MDNKEIFTADDARKATAECVDRVRKLSPREDPRYLNIVQIIKASAKQGRSSISHHISNIPYMDKVPVEMIVDTLTSDGYDVVQFTNYGETKLCIRWKDK